jgi:hypothetical protein
MDYLVVLLHMLYMGLHDEICACEVIWMVDNNRKPTIFCDVLYHLNVIFLHRGFEVLKRIFNNAKTTRTKCTKVHSICLYSSNEIAQRDLSNGVNFSSNIAFMRKLQHKQWRVNFKTQLTSKSHNFLLQNLIEVKEKSMERY